MYRRKTVEALLRQNQREIDRLLTVIADQNDRLMYLAGMAWNLPPSEPLELEHEEPEPTTVDASELVEDY